VYGVPHKIQRDPKRKIGQGPKSRAGVFVVFLPKKTAGFALNLTKEVVFMVKENFDSKS